MVMFSLLRLFKYHQEFAQKIDFGSASSWKSQSRNDGLTLPELDVNPGLESKMEWENWLRKRSIAMPS
jgi:hypothetical protein